MKIKNKKYNNACEEGKQVLLHWEGECKLANNSEGIFGNKRGFSFDLAMSCLWMYPKV